jgi:hypothetical protein
LVPTITLASAYATIQNGPPAGRLT